MIPFECFDTALVSPLSLSCHNEPTDKQDGKKLTALERTTRDKDAMTGKNCAQKRHWAEKP